MTRDDMMNFMRQVFKDASAQICGPASEEYSSTDNFTSNFDAHYALYGQNGALSQASEKIYRYKQKGNPNDLIKAIGWITLLLTKDGNYGKAAETK